MLNIKETLRFTVIRWKQICDQIDELPAKDCYKLSWLHGIKDTFSEIYFVIIGIHLEKIGYDQALEKIDELFNSENEKILGKK